jgi:murein DD-endopeptidase / murein LD-carboxypeptidase
MKIYIFYILLFVLFIFSSCVPTVRYSLDNKNKKNKTVSSEVKNSSYQSFSPQDLIEENLESEAKKWLGTPYKWGGNSRRGIDCSAFVQNVYNNVGVKLPRTAHQQYEKSMIIKNTSRKVGDLIFFKKNGKNSRGNVTHVGIYLGSGKIIHSSSKKGVIIQNIDNSYLAKRYFAVGRVL